MDGPSKRQRPDNTLANNARKWTEEQDKALVEAVKELGSKNWMAVAERVPDRDNAQCLQRWNKVLMPGLKKGPWAPEEDAMLRDRMLEGFTTWKEIASGIPGRTVKQCRERWRNRLDPSIKKEPFSPEEDQKLQEAYELYGNRWTQIAGLLPGRTEDAVKIRWKHLNPNRPAHVRTGRPRALPEESKGQELSPTNPMPAPSYSDMLSDSTPNTHVYPSYALQDESLPEPISVPAKDENISEEDLRILKGFLRSHSNGSINGLGDSFRMNGLGDSFRALPSIRGVFNDSAESGETTAETGETSNTRGRARTMMRLLSLGGSSGNLSMRSLSLEEAAPDEDWIETELQNQRNSGLPIFDSMSRLLNQLQPQEGSLEDEVNGTSESTSTEQSSSQSFGSLLHGTSGSFYVSHDNVGTSTKIGDTEGTMM